MSDHRDDSWLDAPLREGEPYIDDDGFTNRVVAHLPPPRRAISKRPLILLGMTVVAACGGLFVSPIRTALTRAALDLGRLPAAAELPVGSAVLVAMVIWAAIGLVQSEA